MVLAEKNKLKPVAGTGPARAFCYVVREIIVVSGGIARASNFVRKHKNPGAGSKRFLVGRNGAPLRTLFENTKTRAQVQKDF